MGKVSKHGWTQYKKELNLKAIHNHTLQPIFLKTNRKSAHRKGKVQLINAITEKFYSKMRKSLGKKRVEFSPVHVTMIEKIFLNFEDKICSKIFDHEDFGYALIIVNRPLRNEKASLPDVLGNIITDNKGKPKPDSKLKDKENIPLKENIQAFFEQEVFPFALMLGLVNKTPKMATKSILLNTFTSTSHQGLC